MGNICEHELVDQMNHYSSVMLTIIMGYVQLHLSDILSLMINDL